MLKLPKNLSHKANLKKIAVLTSGGDAPGMNAAIRAIVRYGIFSGCEIVGIQKGYVGLVEGLFKTLELSSVANVIQRGGTILKTARCDEFHKKAVRKKAAEKMREHGIDGLIVIGGDGSFQGAHLLYEETAFPVIGVPGTIDNDIFGTDETIGFDTAVNTAVEAIDRIRDTASSHDRVFLVEVMGRNSGFIALEVGVGGGAETIVVPESKISPQDICKVIDRGQKRGKTSSIIVVAEGPTPGYANSLAVELEKKGHSPRVCILGHTQRGGAPTASDRYLGSTLGAAAVQFLLAGKTGVMTGVKDSYIVSVPFTDIFNKKKPLPKEPFNLAKILAR